MLIPLDTLSWSVECQCLVIAFSNNAPCCKGAWRPVKVCNNLSRGHTFGVFSACFFFTPSGQWNPVTCIEYLENEQAQVAIK
jgi:hypothetical protein